MIKIRRRLAGIFMVAVLLLSCMPGVAFADSGMTFGLDVQQENEQVTVLVNLNASGNVGGLQFALKYDSSMLQVTEAEVQGAYRNMMYVLNTDLTNEMILAAASASGVSAEKTVLKAVFSMKSSVKEGSTLDFQLTDTLVSDREGNSLYSADKAASASIVAETSGTKEADQTPSKSLSRTEMGSYGSGTDGSAVSSGAQTGSSSGATGTGAGTSMESTTAGQQTAIGSDSVSELFSDVKGNWAADYIQQACDKKLMQGMGDGTFAPAQNLTRAQMAQVLYNNAGQPEAAAGYGQYIAAFKDLTADWYRDAIGWAVQKGYFRGMGNGIFDPDGTLTREQLAQVIMNVSGESSGVEQMLTSTYDGQYQDSKNISAWAKPAVYWTIYKGILCGKDSVDIGSSLNPTEAASRAQVAVMMVKYANQKS